MLAKADFERAIAQTINRYPDLATRYHAHDPIILQHLEAIATMLAMLAQSIDVAQTEVFEKARDSTVLADAAMRGIVPKAKPARVELVAENGSDTAIRLEVGRQLQDARGRPWVIVAGADVPAAGTAAVQAEQRSRATATYTVTRDEPFHAVPVATKADDGQQLAAITVSDGQGVWTYADHYTNIAADERIYHVEVDERQRAYVRFGMRGVVGVQPQQGAQLTIQTDYSFGAVTPDLGSPFALASIYQPQDSFLSLSMVAMVEAGQNPISTDVLRLLAQYPSVYNSNAVYLGEFDFLVRRHFASLRFLSVWNEHYEERARGYSLDNVNTLFIACFGEDGHEAIVDSAAQSRHLHEGDLTSLQTAIRDVVRRADDSYKVQFVTPLRSPQTWHVDALVGSAYQAATVAQRLREAVLSRYGEASMRRGGMVVPLQEVYAHLREQVPEIAEPGADISVTLPDIGEPLPETWHYVADVTLNVRVSATGLSPPSWGW